MLSVAYSADILCYVLLCFIHCSMTTSVAETASKPASQGYKHDNDTYKSLDYKVPTHRALLLDKMTTISPIMGPQ